MKDEPRQDEWAEFQIRPVFVLLIVAVDVLWVVFGSVQ